jgi:hypothetical protein
LKLRKFIVVGPKIRNCSKIRWLTVIFF